MAPSGSQVGFPAFSAPMECERQYNFHPQKYMCSEHSSQVLFQKPGNKRAFRKQSLVGTDGLQETVSYL